MVSRYFVYVFKDIVSAIKAYWEAWTIIVDKKLWAYLFIPGLISVFYGLLVGVSAWYWSDNLKEIVHSIIPSDSDSKVLSKITNGFINVGIASTGVVLYKYIILFLVAPLFASLSRRVEESVAGYSMSLKNESDETTINDFTRSAIFSFKTFTKEVVFTLGFILIGLIPVFGILAGPAIFIVQAMYVGFCAMDFTLNRYFTISGSAGFIRQNLGFTFGVGLIFMLLIMIPVVGLFFAPTLSVAAATLKTAPRVFRSSYAV